MKLSLIKSNQVF